MDSMAKATGIVAARSSGLASEVQPNALYVRFLPRGKMQKDALRKYMRLHDIPIFDHPLDYKASNRWKEWVDVTLPESTFAYYATVPLGFEFIDSIRHQRIKSLFLAQPIIAAQEQDGEIPFAGRSPADESGKQSSLHEAVNLMEVEKLSRQITGNEVAEPSVAGRTAFWSRWRPSGTITYQDDELGKVPVVGVRVTAGYSYYWRSSTTDARGYFSSPERWTYSCEYELHWDAPDFLMEDGDSWYGADLYIQGPTNYQAWNKHLTGRDAKHAAVFMGARNYYYGERDGLPSPKQNGWLSVSLDFQIYDREGDAYGVHAVVPYLANWIEIYLKRGTSYRTSSELYGTMVHELAHSAHYESFQTRHTWVPRDFEWTSYIASNVKETYARGVQWHLTRKRYPSYKINSYTSTYTSIVQDLIDADAVFGNSGTTGDKVSGFSISDLSRELMRSFSMSEYKGRVVNLRPGETANINAVFAHWGY